MMNDINQLGQEGWKIIQMIESPWMNGLTEITVFFEYAYFQEND
jgi:hypothetical protein